MDELSYQELKQKEKEYDLAFNEGGDGFNPYRAYLEEHFHEPIPMNKDLETIEFQAQRILADAAKVDATSLTAIRQQIDEEKNKRLAFKEEVTAKLKEAQSLSLGTEIPQGTLEQTVTVKIGDDLDALMGTEILLEDGKIVAFRQ